MKLAAEFEELKCCYKLPIFYICPKVFSVGLLIHYNSLLQFFSEKAKIPLYAASAMLSNSRRDSLQESQRAHHQVAEPRSP